MLPWIIINGGGFLYILSQVIVLNIFIEVEREMFNSKVIYRIKETKKQNLRKEMLCFKLPLLLLIAKQEKKYIFQLLDQSYHVKS